MPQLVLSPSSIPPPTSASWDHLSDQWPVLKILITGPLLGQPWLRYLSLSLCCTFWINSGHRSSYVKNTVFLIFIDNLTIIFNPHFIWCLKEIGVNSASPLMFPGSVCSLGSSSPVSAEGSGGCWSVLSFMPLFGGFFHHWISGSSSLGILGHPLLVLMLTGSTCHVCVGCGLMGYILLLPHHVVGNFTSIETWGSVKVGASEFKVCGCWTRVPKSCVRGQFYVFTPVHIIYSSWELKPRRLISWHLLNNTEPGALSPCFCCIFYC